VRESREKKWKKKKKKSSRYIAFSAGSVRRRAPSDCVDGTYAQWQLICYLSRPHGMITQPVQVPKVNGPDERKACARCRTRIRYYRNVWLTADCHCCCCCTVSLLVLAATSDGNTLPHRGNHSKRSSQNWDNINIWCTRVVRSVYHLYLGVREGGTTVGPGNRCRHANNCPALYLMTSI